MSERGSRASLSDLVALTRAVSPHLDRCLVTHVAREPIDVDRARRQHEAYERLLEDLGAEVVRVPAAPDLPDSVFVEDCAVVVDEVAVIARPGARSRVAEIDGVAECLMRYRQCVWIEEPGTLDGGDVVIAGCAVYVGRSSRTNDSGIDQLHAAVAPYGYTAIPVEFGGALHLKSVCTALDSETVFLDPRRVDVTQFRDLEYLAVPGDEWPAANTLPVHGTIVLAAGFPQAASLLSSTGRDVRSVDISEFRKAEGAVSCKCVLLRR
ncbi:MAG TPA: N(G),N(G)-dimethylarginine dimethylaminohydrolase [Gemmatimonadales bacterium]|jgi:dimethylargininase